MVERARVRAVARGLRAALAIALIGPGLASAAERTGEPVALPAAGSCRGCNVIVISLDTLRPDRLETYGYHRPTSPNLAAFAREALVFDRAYSSSGVTAESHMSIFTSLHPSAHRVMPGEPVRPLAIGIPTLTEVLAQQGYATGGFHDGGHLAPEYGFDRGFDIYRHGTFAHARGWLPTLEWLARRGDQPFFLFLHTYFAHDPYTPGRAWRERFAPGGPDGILSDRLSLWRAAEEHCAGRSPCDVWREAHRLYWSRIDRDDPRHLAHVSGLYDAQVRELDTAFLRVMLAARNLPRDTLVVVLSDHGEAFGEHGEVLHTTLYQEITRVPLLVRHPRARDTWGRRVAQPVSLLDVAPAVLDWLGIGAPASFQGRPWSGAPASAAAPGPGGAAPEPGILSEYPSRQELALVRGPRKILLRAAGDALAPPAARLLARIAAELDLVEEVRPYRSIELYDLEADPGEERDLGPSHPDFEPMLRAALAHVAANRAHRASLAVVEAPEVELSPDTRRQLEALGYLD